MPIVDYRGKKITFADDMTEAEINSQMPSIADQIDADLSAMEKPVKNEESFADKAKGFAKDLALKPFRDAVSIARMTDNRSVTEGLDGEEAKESGFDSEAGSRVLKEAATKPQETLKKGAKIVDGAAGIAEVGLRKGYAGLGRIESGLLRAAGDLTDSDTLRDTAAQQSKYADEVESGAILRGTKSTSFEPDSIVQEAPKVATDAIGSIITSAPAVVGGALTGGGALPTIFATSALSDYGASRDKLNVAGSVAHALATGAAETLGEKLGGTDKFADALTQVLGGKNKLAELGVKMLTTGAKEIPSEEVTTTAQFLLDKSQLFGLNQDATLDDYIQQVQDTAKVAAFQGGAMAGAGGTIKAVLNKGADIQAPLPTSNHSVDRILAAQQQVDADNAQEQAESDAAVENITHPDTTIDEAIALAEGATNASLIKPKVVMPITQSGDSELLAKLEALGAPINDQSINATDILDESNGSISSANDGLATVVENTSGQEPDLIQGSVADLSVLTDAITGQSSQLTEEPLQSSGDVTPLRNGNINADAVTGPKDLLTAVDVNANDASTSQFNDTPEPTQAQKEAGNYKVGKVKLNGLDISIENPHGSTRSGTDKDGKSWESTMNGHYGYVKGVVARAPDKEHVDVNIKTGTPDDYAGEVYVVNQNHPDTGKFDEPKVYIGYDSQDEAESAYRSNYASDWKGLDSITPLPIEQFKAMLNDKDAFLKPIQAKNVKTPDALPALVSVSPVESNGPIEVAKIGGKNSTEKISVASNGKQLSVLYNGEPLLDYETEQEINVPTNATIDEIKKAVKASGQFNKQILTFDKAYVPQLTSKSLKPAAVKPTPIAKTKATVLNEKFAENKDILRAWMPDMDWATIGGRIIRDDDNQVSGRTTWEPKDYDLDAIRKGSGLSYPGMQKAVQKAVDGKPLSKVENAAIDAMIELVETIKNSNQTVNELDDNPFLTVEEEDALAQLVRDMNWMALIEQSASDDNVLASISSQAQNYQDAFNDDIGEYLEQIAEYERRNQSDVSQTDAREPQESAGRNEPARENESNADSESQKQTETSSESATKKLDLLGQDTASKQAIADAERAKDAKRNSGTDNQDAFNLTGSDSESDKASAAGAQDLFSQLAKEPVSEDVKKPESEPAQKQEAKPEVTIKPKTPLDDFDNAMDEYEKGIANVDDYKKAFESMLANEQSIKDYLDANFTKQQLFDRGGRYLESRYKSEKKIRVVGALYSDMVSSFLLPNESGMTSYSSGFGEERYKGIKSQVEAITQDSLDKAMDRKKEFIEKNKEAQTERLQGMDDPKTLEDYSNILRAKMADGMALKDARLSLTPDQREIYDNLYADKTLADRAERKEVDRGDIRTAGQTVNGAIIETKHTKKLTDLFVVQLAERVSKEDYTTLNSGAKNLGGYYSSFRGAGAVPGFQFTSRENAEAFVKLAGGDNSAANEQSKERRDAFEDDKSQSAVERLSEMANKLEEKADEELSRERKSNTSRRAGMAARAEAQASTQKAMAITMRNIAQAIESGKAKYLGKVRQKVQVELLQSAVSTAQYDKLRKAHPEYINYEKHKDEPPNKETADHAEFPSYTAYRSDLARLGRSMVEVDGLKLLGNRILSVADDVTDAYLKFAKANLDKVARFTTSNGASAAFSSKALAEEAIARSGFKGKAIVLPFKRGENLIIDSPSASAERGVWDGDSDKRITLSGELGAELVEKIGKANRRKEKVQLPWQFENAFDKRSKLKRMGIENAPELRAALREFIGLKEEAKQPDKIKQLERAMIGRKNDGLDFFPTPASASDEMIDAADIKEGMNILEPSAGMGHIADRIREAGFEPDVVEFSGDRRELLETKGYNVVGSDFLGITEKYDRIIMNPPFSNRRDEEHVRHAYKILKPNGKLVAIMGEGVFFGNDKRATQFRDWLESVGGTSEKLDEGTFKDASLPVNTSVNARMVVIEKSANEAPLFSRNVNNQTSTPEFKKWFGDSKVVDENGEPLVVYHGTNKDFTEFSIGGRYFGYFSNNKEVAKDYGKKVDSYYIKIEDLEEHDFHGKWWKDDYGIVERLSGRLERGLIDGFVLKNTRDPKVFDQEKEFPLGDIYVVKNPNKIKSATGNNGNFDANNNDIRFSKAETFNSMPKADVTKAVDSLRSKWKNAPQIIVVEDMADPAIREAVRAENDRQLSQGATGQPEGFFDAGKVYIVASEMSSADDVRRVVFHETLGHYGLRGVFGKDLAKVLENITVMRRKELNAKAKQYGLDTTKASDRLIAAEEVLAEMAQTNPQLGFVQRAIAAIRTWLRNNGFTMKLTDNDIIANYLMPARAYVQRGGKEQSTGNMVAAFNRTNRVPSKEQGDSFLTAALEFTARNEEFFENANSDAKGIGDIAKEIDPGYRVEQYGKSQTKLDGAEKAWEIYMPDSKYRSAIIYEKGNEVWINVARLQSGENMGNQIYSLAAAYAHNNDKVFIGDPLGLTPKAFYRRAENMLSSALKYGTTKHLRAHLAQEIPAEYYASQGEKEFGESVRPINWIDGNDVHNIKELVYTAHKSAVDNLPEIRNVIFDPTSSKFTTVSGEPFTDQDFEAMLSDYYARSDGSSGRGDDDRTENALGNRAGRKSNPYRAGIRTAKRAALFNTFLREQSSERRNALLGAYVRQLQGQGLAPTLKGVMYSRSNPQATLTPQWDGLEDSKLDDVIRKLQDKNIDLKRVTQSIKKASGDIDDRWNAYLQEELYHGRTAKRTQDFIKEELEPLINDMRMRNVSMPDFEQYLWARHAEERNIQIAKVNPEMPDGGSGMTTQEAKDYLANLTPVQSKNYQALAKRIDAINKKSRQTLVEYGLESTDTIAAMEAAYQYYVPLQREDMDVGFGSGMGQGFSIKGSSSKRATGSSKNVVDIIANIAQQREKNIVRGEKNRVSTALIGLAKLNPNEDFWQVDIPTTIKAINKATGLVEERTDPNYKTRDNVVVARIKNKRGQIEERAVVFNEYDNRAMRMAASIKNLDVDNIEQWLEQVSKVTRYFASVNTQYNPIFGIINITRDVQGAVLNLTSTELAGKQKEVIANTLPALKGIYQDVRSVRKGKGSTNSDWSKLWEEFQTEGGQTGFRDLFKNAADRGKAIEKALDPAWWTKTLVGKVVTVNGLLTVPESVFNEKAIKPVFDWLSDYNETLENSVRLAAYKVGKDNGMSKQQAASLAKNLTVNFNRKGNYGRSLGSLYAFFNASTQGTARLAETFTGKRGKQIVAGGILLGVMQAVALSLAGYDDDEPPEFVKDRNIIIPLDWLGVDGKYATLPMPLGFNVLPGFGRVVTEWAMSGGKDTQKHISHIFGMFMEMFNPIGGNGSISSMIMPTAADPFNDLDKNKDWTGKPIAREDFNSLDPTPGFTRTRDKAWNVSVELAKYINYMSGGTDYKPGEFSPTGDQIEYLAGQVTGGVGREIIKTGTTIEALTTGEDLPTYKIPLVGRFVGNANGQSSQGAKFYANLREMNAHENEIKGRRKDGEDIAEYRADNPEVALIPRANLAEKMVSKMRKRQREMIENEADPMAIKAMDEKITAQMTRFNELVRTRKELISQ
ncbi:MAG TPA: LPD38 domain-containing protein [Methylotenera sp.]|nr:LPD38 domain-containing protein [Methylotenera sp.]